jgi:endonuclease/exonuclease/phosphatase family metal-dependent hydrolase
MPPPVKLIPAAGFPYNSSTMKPLKLLFRAIAAVVLIFGLYLGAVIVWGTVTDYKPADIIPLDVRANGATGNGLAPELTVLSWNIGYCGLGAEMDFFYDGGTMVRPGAEQAEKFTRGVLDHLKSSAAADFIILQEVDKRSSRTRKQDETEMIGAALPGFAHSFGTNYLVRFNPVPFTNPLGRIEAGQMTLSKAPPVSSERYAYHSAYGWPKQLFMLDRCFLVSRFKTADGKMLVLLNNHNSAYDPGGNLRNVEMPLIRDLMVREYEKGNYVVAGGDWNQNPPGFDPSAVGGPFPAQATDKMDSALFPAGWTFAYDPGYPSNRNVDIPLKAGVTKSTVIDFYILSPNVRVVEVKTERLDFEHSDHNPVFLKIGLI